MLNNYTDSGGGYNSNHGQAARPTETQKAQNIGTSNHWGYNSQLEGAYYNSEHQPMFFGSYDTSTKHSNYPQYSTGTIHQPVPTPVGGCQEACCQRVQGYPLNPAPLRYQPSAPVQSRYPDLSNSDPRQGYYGERRTIQTSVSRKKVYNENGYPGISERNYPQYMGRGQTVSADTRQQMQMMRSQYPVYPPYWGSSRGWGGGRVNCPPPPYHQSVGQDMQLHSGLKLSENSHYIDPSSQKMLNSQHRSRLGSVTGGTEIIRPVPEPKRSVIDPNLQSCYEFGYSPGFLPFSEVNKMQVGNIGTQNSNVPCKIPSDKQYHPHQMQYTGHNNDRSMLSYGNPIGELSYPLNYPYPSGDGHTRPGMEDSQHLTDGRKLNLQYESSALKKRPDLDLRQYLATWQLDDDEEDSARLSEPPQLGSAAATFVVGDSTQLEEVTSKIQEQYKATSTSQDCSNKPRSPTSELKRPEEQHRPEEKLERGIVPSEPHAQATYAPSMPTLVNDSEKNVNFWNGSSRESDGIIGKGGAFQPLDCSKRDSSLDPPQEPQRDPNIPKGDLVPQKGQINNNSSFDALVSYYGENRRIVDGYDFVEMTERIINNSDKTNVNHRTDRQVSNEISRPCDPRLQQSQSGGNPSMYNKMSSRYPSSNFQHYKPVSGDPYYNYKHPGNVGKFAYENMPVVDSNFDYHKFTTEFENARSYGNKEILKDPRRMFQPVVEKIDRHQFLEPHQKASSFQEKPGLDCSDMGHEQFISPVIMKTNDYNKTKPYSEESKTVNERSAVSSTTEDIQPHSESTVLVTSQNGPSEIFRVPYSPEKETCEKDNVVTLHSGDQNKSNTITVEVPYVQQYSTLVKLSEEISKTDDNRENDDKLLEMSHKRSVPEENKKPTCFKLKRLPNSKEWTVEGKNLSNSNSNEGCSESSVPSSCQVTDESDILKTTVSVSNLNMPSLDDIRDVDESCDSAIENNKARSKNDVQCPNKTTSISDEIIKTKYSSQPPQLAIVQPMKPIRLEPQLEMDPRKDLNSDVCKDNHKSHTPFTPQNETVHSFNLDKNISETQTEHLKNDISKHENFRTHKKIQRNFPSNFPNCLSSPNENFSHDQVLNSDTSKGRFSPFNVYSDCEVSSQIPDFFKMDNQNSTREKILDARVPTSPGVEGMFEDINHSNNNLCQNQTYQSKSCTFQDLSNPNNMSAISSHNTHLSFSSIFVDDESKKERPDGSVLHMGDTNLKHILDDFEHQQISRSLEERVNKLKLSEAKKSPPIPPISLKLNESKKMWCITNKEKHLNFSNSPENLSLEKETLYQDEFAENCSDIHKTKINNLTPENTNKTFSIGLRNKQKACDKAGKDPDFEKMMLDSESKQEFSTQPCSSLIYNEKSELSLTSSESSLSSMEDANETSKDVTECFESENQCLSIAIYHPRTSFCRELNSPNPSKEHHVLVFDEKGVHFPKAILTDDTQCQESRSVAEEIIDILITNSINQFKKVQENERSNTKGLPASNPPSLNIVREDTVVLEEVFKSSLEVNCISNNNHTEIKNVEKSIVKTTELFLEHEKELSNKNFSVIKSCQSEDLINKTLNRSIFSPMSDCGKGIDSSNSNVVNIDSLKNYDESKSMDVDAFEPADNHNMEVDEESITENQPLDYSLNEAVSHNCVAPDILPANYRDKIKSLCFTYERRLSQNTPDFLDGAHTVNQPCKSPSLTTEQYKNESDDEFMALQSPNHLLSENMTNNTEVINNSKVKLKLNKSVERNELRISSENEHMSKENSVLKVLPTASTNYLLPATTEDIKCIEINSVQKSINSPTDKREERCLTACNLAIDTGAHSPKNQNDSSYASCLNNQQKVLLQQNEQNQSGSIGEKADISKLTQSEKLNKQFQFASSPIKTEDFLKQSVLQSVIVRNNACVNVNDKSRTQDKKIVKVLRKNTVVSDVSEESKSNYYHIVNPIQEQSFNSSVDKNNPNTKISNNNFFGPAKEVVKNVFEETSACNNSLSPQAQENISMEIDKFDLNQPTVTISKLSDTHVYDRNFESSDESFSISYCVSESCFLNDEELTTYLKNSKSSYFYEFKNRKIEKFSKSTLFQTPVSSKQVSDSKSCRDRDFSIINFGLSSCSQSSILTTSSIGMLLTEKCYSNNEFDYKRENSKSSTVGEDMFCEGKSDQEKITKESSMLENSFDHCKEKSSSIEITETFKINDSKVEINLNTKENSSVQSSSIEEQESDFDHIEEAQTSDERQMKKTGVKHRTSSLSNIPVENQALQRLADDNAEEKLNFVYKETREKDYFKEGMKPIYEGNMTTLQNNKIDPLTQEVRCPNFQFKDKQEFKDNDYHIKPSFEETITASSINISEIGATNAHVFGESGSMCLGFEFQKEHKNENDNQNEQKFEEKASTTETQEINHFSATRDSFKGLEAESEIKEIFSPDNEIDFGRKSFIPKLSHPSNLVMSEMKDLNTIESLEPCLQNENLEKNNSSSRVPDVNCNLLSSVHQELNLPSVKDANSPKAIEQQVETIQHVNVLENNTLSQDEFHRSYKDFGKCNTLLKTSYYTISSSTQSNKESNESPILDFNNTQSFYKENSNTLKNILKGDKNEETVPMLEERESVVHQVSAEVNEMSYSTLKPGFANLTSNIDRKPKSNDSEPEEDENSQSCEDLYLSDDFIGLAAVMKSHSLSVNRVVKSPSPTVDTDSNMCITSLIKHRNHLSSSEDHSIADESNDSVVHAVKSTDASILNDHTIQTTDHENINSEMSVVTGKDVLFSSRIVDDDCHESEPELEIENGSRKSSIEEHNTDFQNMKINSVHDSLRSNTGLSTETFPLQCLVEAALALENVDSKQILSNNTGLSEICSQANTNLEKSPETVIYQSNTKDSYENRDLPQAESDPIKTDKVPIDEHTLTSTDREIFSKFEENNYNLRASTKIVTSSSSNIIPYSKRYPSKYIKKMTRSLGEKRKKSETLRTEKSRVKKRKDIFSYYRSKRRKKVSKNKNKHQQLHVQQIVPDESCVNNHTLNILQKDCEEQQEKDVVLENLVLNGDKVEKYNSCPSKSPHLSKFETNLQLGENEKSDFGGPLIIANENISQGNIFCVHVNSEKMDKYVQDLSAGETELMANHDQSIFKEASSDNSVGVPNVTLENGTSLVIIIEELTESMEKGNYYERNKSESDVILGSVETNSPMPQPLLDYCSETLSTEISVNESCICPPNFESKSCCENELFKDKHEQLLGTDHLIPDPSYEINNLVEESYSKYTVGCSRELLSTNCYEEINENLVNDIGNWPFVEEEVAEFDTRSESPNRIPEEGRKIELKCSLPWKKIFNMSGTRKVKSKTIKKVSGLELGPAKVEVRLRAPSAEWKVISDYAENSSPVVKVSRLIVQRGSETSSHSEKDSEEENENKRLPSPLPTEEEIKDCSNSSDYNSEKNVVGENWQPVVRLTRSKELDELTLSLDSKMSSQKSSSDLSSDTQSDLGLKDAINDNSFEDFSESEKSDTSSKCSFTDSVKNLCIISKKFKNSFASSLSEDSNRSSTSCSSFENTQTEKICNYVKYSPSGCNSSFENDKPYSPSDPHFSPEPTFLYDSEINGDINNDDVNSVHGIYKKIISPKIGFQTNCQPQRRNSNCFSVSENMTSSQDSDVSDFYNSSETHTNLSFDNQKNPRIVNESETRLNEEDFNEVMDKCNDYVCPDLLNLPNIINNKANLSEPSVKIACEQNSTKQKRRMPKNFFVRKKIKRNHYPDSDIEEKSSLLQSKVLSTLSDNETNTNNFGLTEDLPQHSPTCEKNSILTGERIERDSLFNFAVESVNYLSDPLTGSSRLNETQTVERFEDKHRLRDGGRGLKRPSEGHSKEDTKRRRKKHRSDIEDCDIQENQKQSSRQRHKELHHCLLCHRSFSSSARYSLHVRSQSHRHLELTQRHTIHAMHRLLNNTDCPSIPPLSSAEELVLQWRPSHRGYRHVYHEVTPLQTVLKEHKEDTSESTLQEEGRLMND